MNVKCDVVEDLLPLYIDEICSEESRKIVEKHLEECETCRAKLKSQKSDIIVSEDVIKENLESKKPFKKIKRSAMIKGISLFIGLVLLFLTFADFGGDGVGFSALSGRYKTNRFLTLIEKGQFEKAANYLSYSGGIYSSLKPDEAAKVRRIIYEVIEYLSICLN